MTSARSAPQPRIVCLVPSLTELLCDLDCAPLLVGRTGFCIHPKALVERIAKVGGTKTVNVEKIRRLAPTHLIVNIDENEKPTVDELSKFVPNVIVTHPIEPEDNFELYQRFGALFDRSERAEQLCTRLRAALELIAAQDYAARKVLYLIWRDPWMTIAPDTYIARMLARAGMSTVQVAGNPARYPAFEWEQLELDDCDAVLLSSEPYHFTAEQVSQLQAMPSLANCAVRLIDGEMTSWYGSRAIQGLSYLQDFRAKLDQLHPKKDW